MAINTGVNASKVVAYTVQQLNDGISLSKAVVYVVLTDQLPVIVPSSGGGDIRIGYQGGIDLRNISIGG